MPAGYFHINQLITSEKRLNFRNKLKEINAHSDVTTQQISGQIGKKTTKKGEKVLEWYKKEYYI